MLGCCDNRDFVEKIEVDVICGYVKRFEIDKKNIPEIQVSGSPLEKHGVR